MPAWVWFLIAFIALVAGLALLAVDKSREGSRHRERLRWADLRGWQFAEEDARMVSHWTEGAMGYYGAEAAVNVVAGSTFTSEGRRTVYVFDIESDRQIPASVVAVRCGEPYPVLLELWLASVPFQRAEMPELLGPAGQRYAFTDDVEKAKEHIAQNLIDHADQLGGDVSVLWMEQDWVLAAVSPNAGPTRLERLLRDVGEIADIIDPTDGDDEGNAGKHVWQDPPEGVRHVDNMHEKPHGPL
ncbi:MAG: hypothetical protein ACRDQB_11580 [Thermocrispum sp.]